VAVSARVVAGATLCVQPNALEVTRRMARRSATYCCTRLWFTAWYPYRFYGWDGRPRSIAPTVAFV